MHEDPEIAIMYVGMCLIGLACVMMLIWFVIEDFIKHWDWLNWRKRRDTRTRR